MNSPMVPTIFASDRVLHRRRRSLARAIDEQAQFLHHHAIEDMVDRLSFVRAKPTNSLIVGDVTSRMAQHLRAHGSDVEEADIAPLPARIELNMERPYDHGPFEFIGVIGLLDAINDLPGALIHIRNALAPGGMAIASFVGGGSLPKLRTALLAADGDRPAARIHPMVDHRAAPQLLQRAGWSDPVVDTHTLTVRYSSLDRLIHDLRDHGLTSALVDQAPALTRSALARARATFLDQADEDGKVSETFEIITLTGRRSLAGT